MLAALSYKRQMWGRVFWHSCAMSTRFGVGLPGPFFVTFGTGGLGLVLVGFLLWKFWGWLLLVIGVIFLYHLVTTIAERR